MNEVKKKPRLPQIPKSSLEKAEFFINIALSLLLIATAICFIVSCILIYTGAEESPFTRQLVGKHLKNTAPLSLLTVAFAIFAGIFSIYTKKPKTKNIPIKNKTFLAIMQCFSSSP